MICSALKDVIPDKRIIKKTVKVRILTYKDEKVNGICGMVRKRIYSGVVCTCILKGMMVYRFVLQSR